jgi:hypothetical protein
MKEHRHIFTTWLMNENIPMEEAMMKMLASRLSNCVTLWQAYDINRYTYYTKEKTAEVLPKIVTFVSRLLVH